MAPAPPAPPRPQYSAEPEQAVIPPATTHQYTNYQPPPPTTCVAVTSVTTTITNSAQYQHQLQVDRQHHLTPPTQVQHSDQVNDYRPRDSSTPEGVNQNVPPLFDTSLNESFSFDLPPDIEKLIDEMPISPLKDEDIKDDGLDEESALELSEQELITTEIKYLSIDQRKLRKQILGRLRQRRYISNLRKKKGDE